VVGAEEPLLVGEQVGEGDGCAGSIPRLTPPVGKVLAVVAVGGVVRAEAALGLSTELVEVFAGCGGLASLAEASAYAVQHRVGVWSVEVVLGAGGEGGCVDP
jgi:hypothetical protein